MGKIIIGILAVLFVICAVLSLCTGCASKQPVIVDTGDIQRLQNQLEYYRAEFDRIQSENQRLTKRSLEMAERVNQTSRELQSLGASTLNEVAKLREYIAILEDFFFDINTGQ